MLYYILYLIKFDNMYLISFIRLYYGSAAYVESQLLGLHHRNSHQVVEGGVKLSSYT